jgi:hypothetical protein
MYMPPTGNIRQPLLLALLLMAACNNSRWISEGTPRSEIYRRLGHPSNSDNDTVAVWADDRVIRQQPWRTLVGGGRDPKIVVFDTNSISLTPVYVFSQSTVDPGLPDREICEDARSRSAAGDR